MTVPIGGITGFIRVSGAQQAQRDILGVQRSMTLTGESAGKAAAGIGRTEGALGAVGAASTRASAGSTKYRIAVLGLTSAVEKYNAALMNENTTLATLASREAAVLRANERLQASMATSTTATRRMATQAETSAGAMTRAGTAVSGFARTAAGLGVALGAFELVKKAIDIGKEAAAFQQAMLLIQTNANASASEVSNMTAAVLEMSPEVATKPLDLANALYHVEQNGLRGKQALEALRVGAEGAKIGMADVEDTTNTMTIALAAGIDGMGNMQQAMGTMIAIAGTGDMRLKDLNEALSGGILSVAKGFGATLGDVAAVLATLGDNGIRGRDAATALRQSLMGFAAPAAKGKDALAGIGLQMDSLAKDMEQHGLVHAMNDLEKHMTAAGITGNKVGAFITTAFGRKAGAGLSVLMGEIDRLNIKFDEGQKGAASFGDKWTATTKTTAFAFQQLGAEFNADGIKLAQGALPALAGLGNMLAHGLPAALSIAGDALHPFVSAWQALVPAASTVGHAFSDAAGFIAPVMPILKTVGTAALTVWAVFKGYQIVVYAANAIADYFATVQARAAAGLVSMRAYGTGVSGSLATAGRDVQIYSAVVNGELVGVAASASMTSAVMQEALLRESSAEIEAQLVRERAAASAAVSYAAMRTASETASVAEIEAANAAAAAATRQAEETEAAALVISNAARTAAGNVVASGEIASIGWKGVLGPLLAVGLGIGLLVSMFHKSDTASKEAAAAAKAYTDALQNPGINPKDTLVGAIVKQLSDNNIPELLGKLNDGLHGAAITGQQFVTAISQGGKPLDDLRARLEAIAHAGTTVSTSVGRGGGVVATITPQAQAATDALKHLNDQFTGLTAAAKKELENFKTFDVVAAPISKVAEQIKLSTDAAQQYAGMLGLVVTKDGNLVDSSKANVLAIASVGKAFDSASGSEAAFLSAMSTFSQSAGTAADRAALIGATLKAANGDALGYAAAINAAASANRTLVTDTRTAAAQAVKGGESIRTYMQSIVDLSTGTIRYGKAAAAPLIADLQSTQTAAMGAAQAMYQHARQTMNGKNAADAAYKVYVNQTRGSLMDQATQLGLTAGEAKKLADRYFGMPSKVKTLIESEGGDPVVTILTKIGKMLANIFGVPWSAELGANPAKAMAAAKAAHDKWIKEAGDIARLRPVLDVEDGPALAKLIYLENVWNRLHDKTITIHGVYIPPSGNIAPGGAPRRAAGGGAPEGLYWTGEQGPELNNKRGNRTEVYSAPQSRGIAAALGMRVPGFASGTTKLSSAQSAIGAVQVGIDPLTHGPFAQFTTGFAKAAAAVAAAATHALDGQLRALVVRANYQLGRLRVKIDGQDLAAFNGAIKGTVDQARTAFAAMMTDLHGAGIGSSVISKLQAEDAQLNALIVQRTKLQAGLTALRQASAQEAASVTGAGVGSFDIATAGTGASGSGAVSFGSIYAQALQAKTLITKWSAALKKLAAGVLGHSIAGKHMIASLAEAGPASYPEVEALLSASSGQLSNLASAKYAIGAASAAAGATASNALFGSRIGSLSREVLLDNRQIDKMGSVIGSAVRDAVAGLHFEMTFDSKGLARAVLVGGNKNARRG